MMYNYYKEFHTTMQRNILNSKFMKFNIVEEFRKKSKSFKITAVVAAVIIIVLSIILCILTPNVPAESISFENTTLYLEPGMTVKLKPNITPYNVTTDNLLYRCSNTDIAVMKRDVLTALKEGEIFIYCYDKTNNVKSDVVTVKIVKSISSLITDTNVPAETVGPQKKYDKASYVYCSPNGKKYHKENCSYSGKNAKKILLGAALDEGLEPCSKCNP